MTFLSQFGKGEMATRARKAASVPPYPDSNLVAPVAIPDISL